MNKYHCAFLCISALGHGALWALFSLPVETPSSDRRTLNAVLMTAAFIEERTATANAAIGYPVNFADAPSGLEFVTPPELPELASIAADSIVEAAQPRDASDAAHIERLQKVYRHQISARLHRMLQEASVLPVLDPTHECTVNVIQNERAEVLEVSAERCGYEVAIQNKIKDAIKQMSPLPMPPEGLAMGTYLTLDLSTL